MVFPMVDQIVRIINTDPVAGKLIAESSQRWSVGTEQRRLKPVARGSGVPARAPHTQGDHSGL